MEESKQYEIARNKLLYDKETLDQFRTEFGGSPPAIKDAVDTSATIYEIRTALQYWFDGTANHRTSDRVWDTCFEVDRGCWTLVGDELKYEEDVSTGDA